MSQTATFDAGWITSTRVLEYALAHAVKSGDAAALTALNARALELDRGDLVVKAPAVPTAPTKVTRSLDLDAPASDLFRPDRKSALDQVVRTLERTLDVDYPTALNRLDETFRDLAGMYSTTPVATRAVLARAGIKELDVFSHDVRMLSERDSAVTRQLSADLAMARHEPTDSQGRVQLDKGFDVSALLHNDEERERRWRRARELSAAFTDRSAFDEADVLHLEGGADLVKTLERPVRMAAAHRSADELGMQLDGILESDQTASQRTRELDAAIGALTAARNEPTSSAGVKALDRTAPRFVELDGETMVRAIEVWDQHGHRITLDDAASLASGRQLQDAPAREAADASASPIPVNQAITNHIATHGCDYLCGLEAVTGVDTGNHAGN